jgi:hypothetical protein
MHPFMMHAASPNRLRVPRIITNPAAVLNEPYKLSRPNKNDYCLVERKTLDVLGVSVETGLDWKPIVKRQRIIPERQLRQEDEIRKELARMRAAGHPLGNLEKVEFGDEPWAVTLKA